MGACRGAGHLSPQGRTYGLGHVGLEPERPRRNTFNVHFKVGMGGFPLVGTADQIAIRLDQLLKAGLDGVLLTWLDFPTGLAQWKDRVMPLLEQAGLRAPVPLPTEAGHRRG